MASVSLRHTTPSTRFVDSPAILRVDPGVEYLPDVELRFLTEVTSQLQSSGRDIVSTHAAMDRLCVECNRLRNHLSSHDWKQCIEKIRQSGILCHVHQDAFTYRAYSKPRGYAGDAVMMDLIYGQEEGWDPPEMSAIGRQIFEYTIKASAPSGVRARREYIAKLLDRTLHRNPSSNVLAVASGHLREVSMSSAIRRHRFRNFIALDADNKSLQEVNQAYGRFGITTELADIRKMLTGRLELGTFDLIYSTGLYDYLNEKTAQRLTYHLFSMLQPGGKLVIANFLPSIDDIGYMEACMDWFLIYRDRFEMLGLTRFIQQEIMSDIRVTTEENQNIIFVEITRA